MRADKYKGHILKIFWGVCHNKRGHLCGCGKQVNYQDPIYIRYWRDPEYPEDHGTLFFCSKDCHDTYEDNFYKNNESWILKEQS